MSVKIKSVSLLLVAICLFFVGQSAVAIVCDSTSHGCLSWGGPGGLPLGGCCKNLGAPAATGIGPEGLATHNQSSLHCGFKMDEVNGQCVNLICANCCGGARALGGCDP